MQKATELDSQSKTFRNLFHLPKQVYLCGNSLGLQPKLTETLIKQELQVWQERGVQGHFDHPYNRPWVRVDDYVRPQMASIVGAQVKEVVVMNSLTVNLHLLLVSFYKPTKTRFKIIMEAKAFPSDYFCLESQVKFYGYDPKDAIVQVEPAPGKYTLTTEEILSVVEKYGDETALVLFSGVQYYTGQLFDIKQITLAAAQKGCKVGWDLAHAVGNVGLELHAWNVDFAVWCSYKYLNSGPGGVGGAFVHEKYHHLNLSRFAGWWGSDPKTKFEMDLEFKGIEDANGYRLSNPCVLAVTALKASLDVFSQTTMSELVLKSRQLTGFMEDLVDSLLPKTKVEIITPRNPLERGCQLSLLFKGDGVMEKVFGYLNENGVIVDDRKPNVIRISPAPLYNTFEDVYKAIELIRQALEVD